MTQNDANRGSFYLLARFGRPGEPEHPWDTEPVPWVQDREHHAVQARIGGRADVTVCGRRTGGASIRPGVYAASDVPREGLCVLCEVGIDTLTREQTNDGQAA